MEPSILRHYSADPIVFDPTRTYTLDDRHFKPVGLWLSVENGDGWREWCEAEEFRCSALAHTCDFVLTAEASLVQLVTPAAVKAFERLYLREMFPGSTLQEIDWMRVMREYDGVLVAPYFRGLRFDNDSIWYYGWDCASACIWNLSAVAEVLAPRLP